MSKTFTVKGKVWRYSGEAGWYFVYAGEEVSAEIARLTKDKKKVGFGFIPVEATLGETTWKTTLFPTKEKNYLLAIKANVRRKEGVYEGDIVEIRLALL